MKTDNYNEKQKSILKFYEFSHIGEFHLNHNEDFLIVVDAGKTYKLIAVMDGCSSGTDSHFAATMIGKILRKLAKHEAYREFAQNVQKNLKEVLETIALSLFEELGNQYCQLDLRSDEILSTLILGILDTSLLSAEFMIVGDGFIHIDGKNHEYENDNKPDYIGYHLNVDKNEWFQSKTQKLSVDKFEDLSISTDGIFTFKNHDGKLFPKISELEIIEEFCKNKSNFENSNKLKLSFLKIKEEFGLTPCDDFTLIRILVDSASNFNS